MNYFDYIKKNPEDILVYIEEINRNENVIVFDFLDSNEYFDFNRVLQFEREISNASMVKVTFCNQKNIRENTVYAIAREVLIEMKDNIEQVTDSFLFGYIINLTSTSKSLFRQSVTITELDRYLIGAVTRGSDDENLLDIKLIGNIEVNVRNVGQGNWNEILANKKVRVVYDAGAPMNASKFEVLKYIASKVEEYNKSKPALILSHWDKDHYHSLLAMTDTDLQSFSTFVCPNIRPNITSRILYARIEAAVGKNNVYSVPNIPKIRKVPSILNLISPKLNKLKIYKSTYNKDRNQSGIVIAVVTSTSSAILPGDCHYKLLSDCILNTLTHSHTHNLVVPHHGGKAGKYDYRLYPGTTPDKAVISVGNNRYGHPISHYSRSLTLDWFNVLDTKSIRADIKILL